MVLRSKQAKVLSQIEQKVRPGFAKLLERRELSSLWALYLILISDPRGLDGEAKFRGWMV